MKTPYQPYSRTRTFVKLLFFLGPATAVWSPETSADIIFAANPMGPSSNIYAVSDEGDLKKLTDDSRWRDVTADVAADGTLVFVSDREPESSIELDENSATLDLYMLHPNNRRITPLTESEILESDPAWSPSGAWVAFIERRSTEDYALVLISKRGRQRRTVAMAEDILGLSWSPDGKYIAYAYREGNLSGLTVVPVSPDEVPPRTRVRYSTATEPDVFNKDGGRPTEVKAFETLVASAQWSPDGRKIAYISHSTSRPRRVLRVVDLTTGENHQVSDVDVQVQHPISWAKDGERLLYSALVNYKFYFDERKRKKTYAGAMQIFLADIEGKNKQLTQGDHLHNRPVFSPNEDRVAFLYGRNLDSRQLSVRIMSLDDPEHERQLYTGATRDSFLHWLPSPVSNVVAK